MKTNAVPAQITTFEDKIVGRLGLTQLMLLSMPIFFGGALFVVLPPTMHASAYKYCLLLFLLCLSSFLAIRIKGKLVLVWSVILLRFYFRPRYYVFSKVMNYGTMNDIVDQTVDSTDEIVSDSHERDTLTKTVMSSKEIVAMEEIMSGIESKVLFKSKKKGSLYVAITEVE
jgi:hypothetical protein